MGGSEPKERRIPILSLAVVGMVDQVRSLSWSTVPVRNKGVGPISVQGQQAEAGYPGRANEILEVTRVHKEEIKEWWQWEKLGSQRVPWTIHDCRKNSSLISRADIGGLDISRMCWCICSVLILVMMCY